MAEEGYIKLYRQLRNNWIWKDGEYVKAWIDLIFRANHESRTILYNGKLIEIQRGQFLTSVYKLAAEWGWKRDKVYHFFKLLKVDKMITTIGTTKGTIVTIVKYDDFQNSTSTKSTTKRTTTGTTSRTTTGTTTGTQTINYKNDKEIKESGSAETPSERLERVRRMNREFAEQDARGEGGDDNGWSNL